MEFIVKSDNEKLDPVAEHTESDEDWIEDDHRERHTESVGSSKKRAIQSVQRMTRTIRSAIEESWEVKIDVTRFVSPWIAEQAGFLLTRFEVG